MNKSLSAKDVFNIASQTCNVITYNQIENMQSIDDLFDSFENKILNQIYPYNNNCCLLCYLTKPNYGHWVLLQRSKNRLDFMDSYGDKPDDQLDFISTKFRKESNQVKYHLSKLLLDTDLKIHYNEKQLQELNPDIATCGRYCGAYLKYNMPVEKFANIILDKSKENNITPDELITILTENLIK